MAARPSLAELGFAKSISEACGIIYRSLDDVRCSRSDFRDFHAFFPDLLINVFGFENRRGWLDEPLSTPDLDRVVRLLAPPGLFFQALVRYMDEESIRYEFPLARLPPWITAALTSHDPNIPQYYKQKISQMEITPSSVILNIYEYFVFFMAHNLVRPHPPAPATSSTSHGDLSSLLSTLRPTLLGSSSSDALGVVYPYFRTMHHRPFPVLLAHYLSYLLFQAAGPFVSSSSRQHTSTLLHSVPLTPSAVTTGVRLLTSSSTPPSSKQPPSTPFPSSGPDPHGASNRFLPPDVLQRKAPLLASTLLVVLVDFWLSGSTRLAPTPNPLLPQNGSTRPAAPAPAMAPGAAPQAPVTPISQDLFDSLLLVINNVHVSIFGPFPLALAATSTSPSTASSSSLLGASSPLASLLLVTSPPAVPYGVAVLQGPLYAFLRSQMSSAAKDYPPCIREQVVELWLAYIQPWHASHQVDLWWSRLELSLRLPAYTNALTSSPRLSQNWLLFVAGNFLYYSVLLADFLNLMRRVYLAPSGDRRGPLAWMEQVVDALSPAPLQQALRAIDALLCNPSAALPADLAASRNLILSLARRHIMDMEGSSFEYKSVFDSPVRDSVRELLLKLKLQSAGEEQAGGRVEKKPSTPREAIARGVSFLIEASSSSAAVPAHRKAASAAEKIMDLLSNMFLIDVSCGGPEASSAAHPFANAALVYQPETEASHKLTQRGKQQLRHGHRKCSNLDVPVLRDPLRFPIHSLENPPLARLLFRLSNLINTKLGLDTTAPPPPLPSAALPPPPQPQAPPAPSPLLPDMVLSHLRGRFRVNLRFLASYPLHALLLLLLCFVWLLRLSS